MSCKNCKNCKEQNKFINWINLEFEEWYDCLFKNKPYKGTPLNHNKFLFSVNVSQIDFDDLIKIIDMTNVSKYGMIREIVFEKQEIDGSLKHCVSIELKECLYPDFK